MNRFQDPRPETQDPGPRTQNLKLKIQNHDPGPGIQFIRSRTENQEPGPKICDQGLGSVLRTDISCTNDYNLILILIVKSLTLIWVDFLGVRFFRGSFCGGGKITFYVKVSLVKFSYCSKFHVNITTGSGVMTSLVYKGFTRRPEIGNTLV